MNNQPEAQSSEQASEVRANFDNKVDVIPVKFNFKKKEDTVDPVTQAIIPGPKRPTVDLELPVPSVEGVLAILTKQGNEAELAFLMECVKEAVVNRARDIIDADTTISNETLASFPFDQVTWSFIANLPKAERRGGGISKEVWKDFVLDYIEIMPEVTGKPLARIENAAKMFLNKFADIKTNKEALKLLKDQLTLYLNNSKNAEQFAECVDFLVTKANTLISADSSKLLDSL